MGKRESTTNMQFGGSQGQIKILRKGRTNKIETKRTYPLHHVMNFYSFTIRPWKPKVVVRFYFFHNKTSNLQSVGHNRPFLTPGSDCLPYKSGYKSIDSIMLY